MQIGLIGGIGPAATDYYYQRFISSFARSGRTLELTIVHADSPTLLANMVAGDCAKQVAIYRRLTERLQHAGAGCVVVTSISGHFCIADFKAVSPLPVVDMIEVVRREVEERGFRRLGILGTRTVMASRFYGAISSAEVIPPRGSDLDAVHDAYVGMASMGRATDSHRNVFGAVCERLLNDEGAEAIMLGGTDLALVYADGFDEFPVIDCAAMHVDATIRFATSAVP